MSQEILRFINFLGHGEIALRCDQEPTVLQIQRLVQRARQRLNLRTVIENAKVGDHGGNAAVEKAIDRVRNQASVFLHELSTRIGCAILPQHPLFAWAFQHAAWTLTRFVVRAGVTPFEVIAGHAYNSKLSPFGCPVFAFVGDTNKQKGDAKWQRGIFLTKTLNNDMFVIAVNGSIRVSRSIKMLDSNWCERMQEYRQVLTFPWQLEGQMGTRAFPIVKGQMPEAQSIPGLDDEAASDPEDEPLEPLIPAQLTPIEVPATPGVPQMVPPPMFAAMSGPATPPPPRSTPIVAKRGAIEQGGLEHQTTEQAGPPVPSLQQAGPVAAGMDMDEMETIEVDEEDAVEPLSKKQKLSTMRVGEETLHHVDVDVSEYINVDDFAKVECPNYLMEQQDELSDADFGKSPMDDSELWQPFSELEPELEQSQLARIDELADQIEINRLLEMGVITNRDCYNGQLGSQLTAKFVRTWRKKIHKQKDASNTESSETYGWLRRSRLVAREYNWMDVRDDVYSPSSSCSIVKILPALALSNGFIPNAILGTLDIGDAFLQVEQPTPRIVKLGHVEYVIQRCLPGQRDGSKLWYLFFVNKLKEKFGAEVCLEQPCVLKVQRKAAIVLHVDDVLFMGDSQWLKDVFIPTLESEFRLSYTLVEHETGGSFEFLKRYHVVEPHYTEITVFPEPKHIHTMYERYTAANGKPPKLCKTPCSVGSQTFACDPHLEKPLHDLQANEFRSLVGIAMYVSQERFDVQFATKNLASSLKSPTQKAWQDLGRLIGYMKFSENFALKMKRTTKGCSFFESNNQVDSRERLNCVETFSDSDWSGKSTSAAVHCVNGIVVWSTSRTQKCISLSSTESEWYAATSGACDGLYLHHVISFLCDGEMKCLTLHTDNSAVRMLSKKLGAGRLRHIRGRLLWLQQKVADGELDIRQVRTAMNVSDVNTKSLTKDRFFCLLYMLGVTNHGEPVGELNT